MKRSIPAIQVAVLVSAISVVSLFALPTAAEARHYRHRHYYRPFSFSLAYSWGYPYYYRPYYAYPGYASYIGPDMGAVDLGVKPKKTRVFVDGQYVGTAGQYDGFPRYLWMPRGEHQLVFHYEGYQTQAERVRVQPGVVMKLKFKMLPGEAESPEALFEPPPAEERAERPRSRTRPRGGAPGVDRRQDWREQGRASRDVREAPGQLRLRLEPADSVVYLDGRFLGNGEDLSRLHSPLLVEPGSHTLEVVRPGYRSREVDFEVASDEEVSVEVDLEPDPEAGTRL